MTEKGIPDALKHLIPDERIEAGLDRILAEVGDPSQSMTRSQLVARLLDHRENDVRVYIPRETFRQESLGTWPAEQDVAAEGGDHGDR
jgi:hypothetical protein